MSMNPSCKQALSVTYARLLVSALVVALLLVLPAYAGPFMPAQAKGKAKTTAPQTAPSTVSLGQLADILENDTTRHELVRQLRSAASAGSAGQAAGEQASPEKQTPPTAAAQSAQKPKVALRDRPFARRMAHNTRVKVGAIVATIAAAGQGIAGLVHDNTGGSTGTPINWAAFGTSVVIFAVVAIATLIVLFLLRRLIAPLLFERLSRLPGKGHTRTGLLLRRTLAVVLSLLVDVVIVFIAAGVGYLVGLYAVGEQGVMGMRQSLFINAFIFIELLKVIIRAVFSSRYEGLRAVRISADVAAWWSLRLRWFLGVIGYALLVVVPIVSKQLSPGVGSAVTFIVMVGTYIYALRVIFGNRRILTQRLLAIANNASLGFFTILYRLLAWTWPVLAVLYFTTLFIVSQLYPEKALPAMLIASVQTLVVAAVCLGVSGLLSHSINRRFRFSERMHSYMPMLETRLNSYIPPALKFVRALILLVFVFVTLDIWDLFDFSAWLGTGAGQHFASVLMHVVLILVVAAAIWIVGASLLELRMSRGAGGETPTPRQQTLLALFRNTLAIIIAIFTIMTCLSQVGVNIGPLIAGAGVFGLAIGFGAQKLVQDIITGVFIQLENAMNTGDVVNLAGTWGTVERMTIRSVSLRDIDGGFHIIPFSSVAVVSNYMREFAYHRHEYRVAYRENIDNVIVHLREAFAELKADPNVGPNILEDMTVPGVTTLDENAVKIRIMIKTVAGTQWGVGRAYNRLVKMHFERAGIEIPYPQQQLWFGEDHQGHAPSAKFRVIDAEEEQTHRDRYRVRKRKRADDEAPDETGDAPGGA